MQHLRLVFTNFLRLLIVTACMGSLAQANVTMTDIGSFSIAGTAPATGQVGYYGNAVAFVPAGQDSINQDTLIVTWGQTDPINASRRLFLFKRITIPAPNGTPTVLCTATLPSDVTMAGTPIGATTVGTKNLIYDPVAKKVVGAMIVSGNRLFSFDLFSTDVTLNSVSYSASTGDSQALVTFFLTNDGRYTGFYKTSSSNWRKVSIGRDKLDGTTPIAKMDVPISSFTGWYPDPADSQFGVDSNCTNGGAGFYGSTSLLLRSFKNSLEGSLQQARLYVVGQTMDAAAINASMDLGMVPNVTGTTVAYGMAFDKASGNTFVRTGYINNSGSPSTNKIFMVNLTSSCDTIAPDAVADLAASNIEPRALTLSWTAPYDASGILDGAASYDVRYSTSPIDDINWTTATQATGAPQPSSAGSVDSMVITGLSAATDYYFAVKSTDTCNNVSALSNVAMSRTDDPDTTPPAAVNDLSYSDLHPNSMVLHWTATGDDGMVGQAVSYDLRYSQAPITEGNFSAATAIAVAAPTAPGGAESLDLHNLTAGVTYYFAIKVTDEWPLTSSLSNVLAVVMPAVDTSGPVAVTDLQWWGALSSQVYLRWTAPADVGSAGVAGYEIRYSSSPINAGNWQLATVAAGAPAVATPGTTVDASVSGLVGGTTYYFAVKSYDWAEPANSSDISNVISGTTREPVGPVALHNPWITNDRVADTRSLATLAATFGNSYSPNGVTIGVTNQDKAINEYNNFKRREYHWADDPPSRNDVVRNINIHGHALCGGQAAQNVAILEAMGLNARVGSFPGHTMYDVYYDGQWHYFDTMMTMYVFDRSNPRKVASSAQIGADKTLMTNAVAEGRACPGFLLCPDDVTWYANGAGKYQAFDEVGGAVTHSMDMDLPFGLELDRTWHAWQNQHPTPKTDADGGNIPGPDAPYHHDCHNDWKDTVNFPYWEPYGKVIPYIHTSKKTYRRWSNGTADLRPDFKSTCYQSAVHGTPVGISTLGADGLMPELHAAAPNVLGEVVFKIKLPFEITDANISGDFVRAGGGDIARVLISTNGTTFTQIWDHTGVGTSHVENLNVRSTVFGKFEFYIKVQVKGVANKNDAGVNNLLISSILQHNKGAMAYLDKGLNNITVSFDNPAELVASGAVLKVAYSWKEFDGTDWTIAKSSEQYIQGSPATFTIDVGGTKVPRTESVIMQVTERPLDPVAPAPILDLAIGTAGAARVPLTWTATGDDDVTGQAMAYDLRYSTSPITDDASFDAATSVSGVPSPKQAGSAEAFTVFYLQGDTTYYFAIRALDKGGNRSALSNVVSVTTLPAPRILDLSAGTAAAVKVLLSWTAIDDGVLGTYASYDLRYSTSPITNDVLFDAATQVTGMPAPKAPGGAETFLVTGLLPNATYYMAIKAVDTGGNRSLLSNLLTVTTAPADVIVPAWIGNLKGKPADTAGAVALTWTAPADYGANNSGPFAGTTYDLRYSTAPITVGNFAAATQVPGLPTPKTPGTAESLNVIVPPGGATYYFAIKTSDEGVPPNTSEISNVAMSKASVLGNQVLRQGLNGYLGCSDSYMSSSSPTVQYGSYERMTVTGYADYNDMQRGLVKFDLSGMPAGAVVRSAVLSLYSYDPARMLGSSSGYGVYPLTRSWSAATSSWNKFDASSAWTTPGGDFEQTYDAFSPKQVMNPKVPVWYTWDVTARVQAWISGSSTNNGWCVKAANESSHCQDQFYQTETSNGTFRPTLIISDLAPRKVGDIDGNGLVNVNDLQMLVLSWAKSSQTRGYEPWADLDDSGLVNIGDLQLLVANWGL